MQENSNNVKQNDKSMNLQQSPSVKKPNESGQLWIEDKIKIFDPATNEVFVQGRT
jgi:hypothetical protein